MTATITVTEAAWRTLTTAAGKSLPREAGGILLGHYTAGSPIVTRAVAIPDPRATRIRYRRDAASAARALAAEIASDTTGMTGYLGEWHTHPLPIGPSGTDQRAVMRLAANGGHDVALVVLALGPHGWAGHARIATSAGSLHIVELHVDGSSR